MFVFDVVVLLRFALIPTYFVIKDFRADCAVPLAANFPQRSDQLQSKKTPAGNLIRLPVLSKLVQ